MKAVFWKEIKFVRKQFLFIRTKIRDKGDYKLFKMFLKYNFGGNTSGS